MDDEEEEKKIKLEAISETTTTADSTWVDSTYFFDAERENTLLNEYGWNLQTSDQQTTTFMEFDSLDFQQQQQQEQQPGSDLAGSSSYILPENHSPPSNLAGTVEKSGDASLSNNPSLSSTSSEEQPEKSSGSVGKPPDKPSKVRKKGQKRTRQQRFAFMTKSDVDHLEDGYRWRKYGQKAVKNSPYPRSYYRCTNSKCTVKKRVERSSEDPAIVITTYEGQHCHHTVSFPRGGVFSHEFPFISGLHQTGSHLYAPSVQYPIGGQLGVTQLQHNHHQHQQHDTRPNQMQPAGTSQNPNDDGLLGDIVPPGMRNRWEWYVIVIGIAYRQAYNPNTLCSILILR